MPTRLTDKYGLFTASLDPFLWGHFQFGDGQSLDISSWCGRYMVDPMVRAQKKIMENRIEIEARRLAGLNGSTTFELSESAALNVTSIYSFGKGSTHKQRARCSATGDGCCVDVQCNLRFYAYDVFDDPYDLCEKHGICDSRRNLGGTPFSFVISCFDSYSARACKR